MSDLPDIEVAITADTSALEHVTRRIVTRRIKLDTWTERVERCARDGADLEVTPAEYVELIRLIDAQPRPLTTYVVGGALGAPWGVRVVIVDAPEVTS